MAYSDFTLHTVLAQFQLKFQEAHQLFGGIAAVAFSDFLTTTLNENTPLTLAIHTEKARSEFIIAPILIELRKLVHHQVSLFSGVDFTIDPAKGLNDVCDFLISQSPEQSLLRAPVLMIVEAKNDNIKSGLAQCIAEMVAAQIFNARAGNSITVIYGVVTTGSIWKFLKLSDTTIVIDLAEYYLDSVDQILGILLHIVQQ